MTGRRWASVAIAGTLGAVVVLSCLYWMIKSGPRDGRTYKAVVATAKTPLRTLAEGIRQGDPQALRALCERVLAKRDQPQGAVGEAEGADLLEVLDGLRSGFLKYNPAGRASAIAASTHILDRFRVEPAPSVCLDALAPIQALLLAGLADADVDVRSSALNEVGQHWSWLPAGR